MNEVILNEFLVQDKLQELKKRRKTEYKRKFWSKEEDNFLLKAEPIISAKDLADFFNVSIPAIVSRLKVIKHNGGEIKYAKHPLFCKTSEQLSDFLEKYNNKSENIEERVSEEVISGYQILSAKSITITSGEVKLGNYTIRGSFTLTADEVS